MLCTFLDKTPRYANLCRNCQILIANVCCQMGVVRNMILENVVLHMIADTEFVTSVLEAIVFITVNNEVARLFFVRSIFKKLGI